MSEHSSCTNILESALDSAFAEHGYLDGIIIMWEEMMFVIGYEYDDIIESYNVVLNNSKEIFIKNSIKHAIHKLSNS